MNNNRTGIIYKATCTETGLAYVGQTTKSLALRKQKHLQKARSGSDTPFHQAIREHGEDAFHWEVLAEGIPYAQLDEEEQSYINLLDTFDNGYNANRGGGGKQATPQLQPCVRFVSESELTLRWDLNRGYNEEHVYALAQDMQAIGGFDTRYPIGTIEIDGELHVYSGHHRATAAFKRDMSPQLFPLLPLAQVPVTVIQGDMDALIEKMWTTHIVNDSEDGTLSSVDFWDEEKAFKILLNFPHYYRMSPRKLSKMWNVSTDVIKQLQHNIEVDIFSIVRSNFEGFRYKLENHLSPERLMAMARLLSVMQAEKTLRSVLPTPSEIPGQQIRWLNECLTLTLPKSDDRLAALQMLLKRLAEDL